MNIVVTGCSRGMGFEIVRLLCNIGESHTVLGISRDKEKLELLKDELKNFIPLAYDLQKLLTSSGGLKELISNHFDHIDILINNAGQLINKPFVETTYPEALQMLNMNTLVPGMLIQQLLPIMGGEKLTHIINIGSMGGFQGSMKFSGLSWYSTSKAALAALTECLAIEFKEKNIKVNCLSLGAAQTEMLATAFPGYKAPVSALEMAQFIALFALEGHRWFNGKVLPVALSTP